MLGLATFLATLYVNVYSVYINTSCGVSTSKTNQAAENFGHAEIAVYSNSSSNKCLMDFLIFWIATKY